MASRGGYGVVLHRLLLYAKAVFLVAHTNWGEVGISGNREMEMMES